MIVDIDPDIAPRRDQVRDHGRYMGKLGLRIDDLVPASARSFLYLLPVAAKQADDDEIVEEAGMTRVQLDDGRHELLFREDMRGLGFSQEGEPGFVEIRPVPRLQGDGNIPRHAIEEGAQRIDESMLAGHLLSVQILEFEDDGANLVFDRREPFEEVTKELDREECGIRFHAAPLMRKRDILRRFDDEAEARIDGGRVLLNFHDGRDLVEPGIDLDHPVALRVRGQVVDGPRLRLVIHQPNPGVVVPGTGADVEGHILKI